MAMLALVEFYFAFILFYSHAMQLIKPLSNQSVGQLVIFVQIIMFWVS